MIYILRPATNDFDERSDDFGFKSHKIDFTKNLNDLNKASDRLDNIVVDPLADKMKSPKKKKQVCNFFFFF